MTTIAHRAPIRPLPGLRRRRFLPAALHGALRWLLRPTGKGRRLDPAALSDGMRRDLGFDPIGPHRR